eukprot:scaffold529968_cov50-Prasinocladus_malaysianus.AAC.1
MLGDLILLMYRSSGHEQQQPTWVEHQGIVGFVIRCLKWNSSILLKSEELTYHASVSCDSSDRPYCVLKWLTGEGGVVLRLAKI